MDKENHSIDDILRLLKDKVENTENGDNDIQNNSESLDTESLKERLREQYSGDNTPEHEEVKDEYALDESFAFIEEEAEPIAPEPKVEAEVLEEVPVAEDKAFLDEPVLDNMEEWVEEPVIDGEEALVEEAEDIAEEAIDETEVAEPTYTISHEYIEMLEGALGSVSAETEVEEAIEETLEAIDDDDLPWFVEENAEIVDKGDSLQQEENESFDEFEINTQGFMLQSISNPEEEHSEYDEIDEIVNTGYDESFNKDESEPDEIDELMAVASALAAKPEENVDDEPEESFYKTITTAEHETLARRAAMRELDEVMKADSFEDSDVDGEYDFDGEEEKIILDGSSGAVADGDIEDDAFVLRNSFEKKYGISTDFLDSDVDDRKEADDNDEAHVADFELGESKSEYEEETQKVSFLASLKPYALGLITALILFFELMPALNIVPNGLFDYTEHGIIYILFDLQLLFFASALYVRRLVDGLMSLLKRSTNVYSVLSITVIMSALYSLFACFCTRDTMPPLYNSISVLYIFVSYCIDRIDAKRVRRSIGELIATDKIFTLYRSHGKNSSADKMYLGGVSPDKNIYEPAGVSGNEFRKNFLNDRTNTRDKTVVYAMTPVLIFSLLIAVTSMVLGEDFSYVINSMMVSFISLAPLSAIISSFLPIYISNKRLQRRGCIIPSYRSARSIGDCDAIIFNDSHLFRDAVAKENGIKIYDPAKTHEVFSCLDLLYKAIGGPMENVFSGANANPSARKINLIRITRSGVEAVIDDRVNIILGTSDYLMRYGIATDFSSDKKNSLGLLYVAMNARLVASLSLCYKTEPIFEALCDVMGDNKIDAVISTYDPVISSAYIASRRKSREARYPVSVVHKNKNDYYKKSIPDIPVSRCGVFAMSSRLKLVELAVFCKRIVALTKINSLIRIASFALSVILSAVFTVSGIMKYVDLLWVLIYQIMLVVAFIAMASRGLPYSLENIKNKTEDR